MTKAFRNNSIRSSSSFSPSFCLSFPFPLVEQRPPGAEKLEHTVINGGQPSLEEMQQPPPPPPPPSETPLTTTPLHEPQSAPTSTTVTQSSPHFTTHPTVTVANMNLVFPYADVSMVSPPPVPLLFKRFCSYCLIPNRRLIERQCPQQNHLAIS